MELLHIGVFAATFVALFPVVNPIGDAPIFLALTRAMDHAFYPLTLPITVRPGCISIAITLGARMKHQGGPTLGPTQEGDAQASV